MCVIVFGICHVLSLCVVLYGHVYIHMWLYYRSCATTVCGYMYPCVTVYITDHMLSLCAVLYMYTYIQSYVIVYITGHVLSLCVVFVRHAWDCLPWVVGWVGWGALYPVAPCSTEVTACVIVYITCGALHESSTLPLSYTHSPYSMHHAHLPRTSFVMFCSFVNALLYERTSPRQIPVYI